MNMPSEKEFTAYEATPSELYAAPGAEGLPGERPVYQPHAKRKMDRMVGTLMTVLGVAVVFLLIIALLMSISPNSPTELVPKNAPTADSDPDAEPDDGLGILGD